MNSVSSRRRGGWMVLLLIVAAGGLVSWRFVAGKPDAGPQDSNAAKSTHPATASTAPAGEWIGFHGGAELRGVAPDIGDAPLVLRWRYSAGESGPQFAFEGSAAIAGGVVYAADHSGVLHAIDILTGKRKWIYTTGPDPDKRDGFETTPLIVGDRVLLGDLAGIFHCVSAAEGKKLWTFDAGAEIHSSANSATIGGAARVVFGTDGADIFCLSVADGTKLWDQKAGDRVNGAPAIGLGVVLVSGCDAQLRAMKVEDGVEQFAADIGSLSPGSPAVLDDRIIMGTDGGRIVCFSPDGKKQLWEYDKIGGQAMVYSSPAVSQGIVVVGARDRKVHALDAATGNERWTFATRADVDSSPAISGNRVFVGGKDKKFYVLDLKTGASLGEFPANRAITASPAIADGVVVIGDTAGNLFCYEPKKK